MTVFLADFMGDLPVRFDCFMLLVLGIYQVGKAISNVNPEAQEKPAMASASNPQRPEEVRGIDQER